MHLDNIYYIYRHIRLDKNEPFHIGIGTKYKGREINTFEAEYSRAFVKTNRNLIWKRIVKKTNFKVEILIESNDYNYIQNKEIEFIKLYGRLDKKLGNLSNMTDGGEHNNGRIRPLLAIEKQRVGIKNYWSKLSKEDKEKRIKKLKEVSKKGRLTNKLSGYRKTYTKPRAYLEKEVIDTKTNIVYRSIIEAFNSGNFKFSKSHLTSMIAGRYKNKTTLKYKNCK